MTDHAILASWTLAADGRDESGAGHHAEVHGGVTFGSSADPGVARDVARFDGDGRLEVRGEVRLGSSEFSLTAWILAPIDARTSLGDVAALFDPDARRGFSIGLHHSSPCGNHGNDRNLFFGIDAGSEVRWSDLGRPSPSTIMVCALAVFEGDLYAATWESGASDIGHVYRLDGEEWTDCGTPGGANAVTRLAVHRGHLFAGSSRLRGGGSGMPDSTNDRPGGHVFGFEGGTAWSDHGALDDADSIAGLVPFAGDLYAIPMYSEGLFRLDDGRLTPCGTPGRRLLALGVHSGALLGAGNDHADVASAIAQTAAGIVVPPRSEDGGGGMFRFDPDAGWSSLGLQPDTTQVYSIETYEGGLFIGTWPNGLVFRHGGDDRWESQGRLGDDTEVMNLLAYQGKLYGGTLPGAAVYRYDGSGAWRQIGILDTTPDVRYRRAASMVVHDGRLVCGTLPSGRVHAMRAGLLATHDVALAEGWRHVAAVRRQDGIELFVDGVQVGRAVGDLAAPVMDLGSGSLVLGGGPRGGFEGELADVELHAGALNIADVARLAARSPGDA
jgi:hypothetical protein